MIFSMTKILPNLQGTGQRRIRCSYSKTFDLKRLVFRFESNQNSVLQEIYIDLNLIAVLSHKNNPTCSPDLKPIEHIWEYKYY